MANGQGGGGMDPKITSIISYLTPVGWIVAYILNKPKSGLANFHLRQALGLHLLFVACNMVFSIPILGWIIGVLGFILLFLLWALGILAALNGEEKPVPFLGDSFQDWFKSL